jgi:hypothetical protein
MTLISAAVSHGYGLHLKQITKLSGRKKTLMLTFLAPAVSVLASTLGKISIVIFLRHLLRQSTKKGHLWPLYSVTVIMIGVNIFMIDMFFGTVHIDKEESETEGSGDCVSHAIWDYGGRM